MGFMCGAMECRFGMGAFYASLCYVAHVPCIHVYMYTKYLQYLLKFSLWAFVYTLSKKRRVVFDFYGSMYIFFVFGAHTYILYMYVSMYIIHIFDRYIIKVDVVVV